MESYQKIIDKYYPAGSPLRDIYIRHCRSVASLALELNSRLAEPLAPGDVEGAAMLHDIGIVCTDAPSICCTGTSPYICHGPIGGSILRTEGAPEEWARVAERHTGTGITPAMIVEQHLPLDPAVVMVPHTTLERLICYADKFYSKSGSMERKSLERARASVARFGAESAAAFDSMQSQFGSPGDGAGQDGRA